MTRRRWLGVLTDLWRIVLLLAAAALLAMAFVAGVVVILPAWEVDATGRVVFAAVAALFAGTAVGLLVAVVRAFVSTRVEGRDQTPAT